jgi:hypothetical protein
VLKRLNKYVLGRTYSQGNYPTQGGGALAYQQIATEFAAIIGSPTQVASGLATYSNPQTALNNVPPGSMVLWLAGTYTGNVSMVSQVKVVGQGYGVQLIGNLTFPSGCDQADLDSIRVTGNISLLSGSLGNFLKAWMDATYAFSDAGLNNDPVVIAG